MSLPLWAWIAWLVTTAGSFAVLETWALLTKNTLTSTLKRWLGINPPRRWRRISIPAFTWALVVFVGWFIPHITR